VAGAARWPGEEAATDASGRADSPPPGQPAEVAPPPAEHEPDARYTFANERTFLAWIRTALALVAAGLAVIQLLPPFHGIRWGRHAIGIPLIVLGAVIAVLSYRDWMANQHAMRRDQPLPRSWLPTVLAVTITAVGVIAAIVVVAAR
jgi:putative membrane protein